ncbi:hypothetical protein ACSSS7_007424 [Eimeria intestinalis]
MGGGGPPTLKYEQLDTLLTCMQASARRLGLPDEEGPSYMTRSRAARSRPGGPSLASSSGGASAPGGAGGAGGGGCGSMHLITAAGAAAGAAAGSGAGGGWRHTGGYHYSMSCGSGVGGQQSPRAQAMDALLLRLKGIVRGMQQNGKIASKEKRRLNGEELDIGSRSPLSPL